MARQRNVPEEGKTSFASLALLDFQHITRKLSYLKYFRGENEQQHSHAIEKNHECHHDIPRLTVLVDEEGNGNANQACL